MTRLRMAWDLAVTMSRIGWKEFRAINTWQTWSFGWFGRLIAQAAFFTLFGVWLHSRADVEFMAIGNAVMLVCMEALAVIPSMIGERYAGTLTLNVAAPGNLSFSRLARNAYCPVMGIISGTVAFFGLTAAFGVHLVWPATAFSPVLIALVSFTVYAFGFAVASVVLSFPSMTIVALNLSFLSIMTFCGVDVPASFWPLPIRVFAQAIPMTHGLIAVRALVAGSPVSMVLWNSVLALLAGIGWVAAGFAISAISVATGRRSGSLELSG